MEIVLSGFALSLSLCMDMGTVNVAIMRAGVRNGGWPAFWIGIGSSVGDLVYAVLSMIGISILLQYEWVRWILWLGGSGMLLYLCVRMFWETFTAKAVTADDSSPKELTSSSNFFQGIVLALASPTAILWFAAVGGSVIAATNQDQTQSALILFFLGFFSAGLLWAVFLALLSGWGGRVAGPKLVRIFSAISAILFFYFSVKVFLNGYQQLL
ncbi:LysE family translocator [Salinithrix halophila]|uniref:LysE family translocator n=1 Tax=Salinithrix halophila TaxID=1485204 RepID=A0ABV8JG57_9BACL